MHGYFKHSIIMSPTLSIEFPHCCRKCVVRFIKYFCSKTIVVRCLQVRVKSIATRRNSCEETKKDVANSHLYPRNIEKKARFYGKALRTEKEPVLHPKPLLQHVVSTDRLLFQADYIMKWIYF